MSFADEIDRRIDTVRGSGDPVQLGLWLQIQARYLHLVHNEGLDDFELPEIDNGSPENSVLVPPPILTLPNSPITLDTGMSTMYYETPVSTREVPLRPTETRMLSLFMRNPLQVLTLDQIFTNVWETYHADPDANVRLYVGYLRQKIEPIPTKPIHLLTAKGTGYRFMP